MTNREALFRAILENPDDDTLRLIYADALEEGGDDRRAAFVRAEVALAGVPEYDPAWIRSRLVNRDERDSAWPVAELPPLPPGLKWARDPFRRGLPAAVEAQDAATFVHSADALFELAPVDSLELGVARLPEVEAFASSPWRHRLVRLAVMQGLGAQSARGLLGPTEFERLSELHIGAGLSTVETVESIVHSRVFKQLTALSWREDRAESANPTGQRRLAFQLMALSEPPRLKRLDLSGNRLTAQQLGPLMAAPILNDVEELVLSDNNLGPEGIWAMTAAAAPRLRSLHLDRTRPESAGFRELSQAVFLPRLLRLTLAGNLFTSLDVWALLVTPHISNLRVLDLHENRLGDAGSLAIAGNPNHWQLLALDLSANQIGDAGAVKLFASKHLDKLLYLDLRDNAVSEPVRTQLRDRFGKGVVF